MRSKRGGTSGGPSARQGATENTGVVAVSRRRAVGVAVFAALLLIGATGLVASAVGTPAFTTLAAADDTAPSRGGGSSTDLRAISYGETETGELDSGDPTGTYGRHEPVTFQASRGDVVTATMTAQSDTSLKLVDPDGSVLAENDDAFENRPGGQGSKIDGQFLPKDGTYTLIATAPDSDPSFEYDLSLTRGGQPDPDAATDLRSISYGETKTGGLTEADPKGYRGDYEPVRFTGSEGDLVDVTVENAGEPTYLVLEASDGSTLASGDSRDLTNVELPSDGPYRVIVTSRADETTGDTQVGPFAYDLSLTKTEPTDIGSISYGETKTSTLDPSDATGGKFSSYRESVTFGGSEGDEVTVTARQAYVQVRLRAPDGTKITTSGGIGEIPSASLTATLPADGQYTIVVEDDGGRANRIESYELSLATTTEEGDGGDGGDGKEGSETRDLDSIEYGQTRTGEVGPDDVAEGDGGTQPYVESVTFQGEQGDVPRISVDAPVGLRLVGPTGQLASTGPAGELGLRRLPADGQYTIEVVEPDAEGEDPDRHEYDLTLERVEVTDLSTIDYGQTKAGALDPTDDTVTPSFDPEPVWRESVTFEGTAGDVAVVEVTGTTAALRLVDPDGDPVAKSDPGDGRSLERTLQASGTYTIQVLADGTYSRVEPYDLTLRQRVTDLRSIGYNETALGRVDPNDPDAAANGGLHEPVTFTGNRSDVIEATTTGGAGTAIYLRGPDGEELASADDGGPAGTSSASLTHELPTDGRYTLAVTGDGPDATTGYTLELRRTEVGVTIVPDDEPPEPIDLREISYGALKHGQVDDGDPLGYRGRYENVSFDAIAGDVVNITMTPEGANASYLAVVGPEGEVLNETTGTPGVPERDGTAAPGEESESAATPAGESADALPTAASEVTLSEVTLPVEGNYTIVAGTAAENATGRYELELEQVRHEEPNLVAEHLEFESAYVDRLTLTEGSTYTTVAVLNNTDDEFHFFDVPTRVERFPRDGDSLTTMNETNVTVGLEAGERRTLRFERTVDEAPSDPRGGRVMINGTFVGNVSVLPGDSQLDGVTYAYTTAQPTGSSPYEVVAVVRNGGSTATTYSTAFVHPSVPASREAVGRRSKVRVGMVHVPPGETKRIRIGVDTPTTGSGRGVWYVAGQPAPLVGTTDDDTEDWG